MRVRNCDLSTKKGWIDGPWLSGLLISIGYATAALDEPHVHSSVTEIFLVGNGNATARVEDRSVELAVGDVLVVEPDEARAIVRASADLMMFVVHVPGEAGVLGNDKTVVDRGRLGL